VVANLPYVPDSDWATLPPEIRDFEPREAVLAGPDGLDAIRHLLASPPDCQAIALEVGLGQAPEVERLVKAASFSVTERRPDLAGIERVVVGRR
jgi:release factor glutamine methyltransferase